MWILYVLGLQIILYLVCLRIIAELKTNCPKSNQKEDECPKVCFDAPNCNAELGKEMGDIFQLKLDAGKLLFELHIIGLNISSSIWNISP